VWRLKQEDHEFMASLGYTVRPCFKKKRRKYILYQMMMSVVKKMEAGLLRDIEVRHSAFYWIVREGF
jgi:hypothetical protein